MPSSHGTLSSAMIITLADVDQRAISGLREVAVILWGTGDDGPGRVSRVDRIRKLKLACRIIQILAHVVG